MTLLALAGSCTVAGSRSHPTYLSHQDSGGGSTRACARVCAAAQRIWEGRLGHRRSPPPTRRFVACKLREIKRMSTTAVQQGRGRRGLGRGRATGGATEAEAAPAPLNRQQLTMYSMMTRTSISAAATVTAACRLLYSSEHPAEGTAAIAFNY